MMEFSQRIRRGTSSETAPERTDAVRNVRDADWYETHGQGD
jgi:hypothetical protein